MLAHAYTAEAISHAASCGVYSIEYANLIDADAPRLITDKGAYVVLTLVTYDALERLGGELGMTGTILDKLATVRGSVWDSLAICHDAGIKMGSGTDLLGSTHDDQSCEFLIRAEVHQPHEVIDSATRIGAEILRREGEIGVIAPGAIADLLVIDSNPLDNLGLLQDQGCHLLAIMKDGQFHKNPL